jgi:hypothetical protein
VNSPPPKPEVILTNFFTEPTVLLVPITSHDFEVNPITHFGVISLFSSNFSKFNTFRPLFQKL